jgi:hypothetical protein
MSDFPLALIEDMASKEAQVRWIVNGDANEYLVPDEMLHEAVRFCELAAKAEGPSTARQRAAIASLCEVLKGAPDFLRDYDRSNIADLIDRDPHWNLIRERAADVLAAFAPLPYD